ncbi:MAG TPA: cation-translocating P-type ATPase [Candidatus Pelethosoma merdigallinarum]|nr:cation-translocating P-type ATPase [Candidatus Pelethosoma merdigallinarum]
MKKIVLKISGMTCSACSSSLEKYLSKQKGISSASVNLVLSLATIEYDSISVKTIEKYISEAGFKSLGEFKRIDELESNSSDKRKLIILGLVVIFLMYVSMYHMINAPAFPLLNHNHPVILATFMLLVSIIFLIYGFDIIKSGIKNLIHKMPNMDTLVMFSVLCSFLYSLYGYIEILVGNSNFIHNLYFESACMVIYFIKLGRFIETLGKDKTKSALKELVQITPEYAVLKKEDEEVKVTIDEVKEDDLLISKAGEKIAVDGIVKSGKSYVDESFITGESNPVLKRAGDNVIAGSILYDGYLEYNAKRIGKSSTISQIIEIVINATSTKSKMQKLADKISGYFVPIVIVIAILTFIIHLTLGSSLTDSLTHFVTILVVACPCALGLAVPLVNVVANGLCAKKGIFLRNGEVLEKAKDIDTLVFDKTGTLTYGKLNVYKMFNYSKIPDKELLNIVANIENLSNHPIAQAFKVKEKLNVTNYQVIPGKGIKGSITHKTYYLGNASILKDLNIEDAYTENYQELTSAGCSIIYVIQNKKVIGLIGLRDTIRKDIQHVIKKFQDSGIEVIMLTGDNKETASIIASEIGITNIYADVLPQDKAITIDNLINDGKKVAMVGDGINDAPALVKSTVGISISDGTDIAASSSDVILMNNDISNILDLINISKKSYRVIKQNLFWAFIYNLCMIPIAAGVFANIEMTPMFGSIAMTISSLTVVLNSYIFGRRKI